jgi:hypothetical protein
MPLTGAIGMKTLLIYILGYRAKLRRW